MKKCEECKKSIWPWLSTRYSEGYFHEECFLKVFEEKKINPMFSLYLEGIGRSEVKYTAHKRDINVIKKKVMKAWEQKKIIEFGSMLVDCGKISMLRVEKDYRFCDTEWVRKK
jgi:hypothetical protein